MANTNRPATDPVHSGSRYMKRQCRRSYMALVSALLLSTLVPSAVPAVAPTLNSLAVTPANPIIAKPGDTQQFTATGTFSDGSTAILKAASAVAGGTVHTCAVMADGTVRCWGVNNFGQLGDGTTMNATTPVQVSGIDGSTDAKTATAVAVGLYHSCVLMKDGSVQCWGRNNRGQLGNGTLTNSSTPVPVLGISTATAITAGDLDGNHSCALLNNGTVKCWGSNEFGQLGNGTNNNSTSPVSVSVIDGLSPATKAVSISAGGSLESGHTCAVLGDGTVSCWGRNDAGQLGSGTPGTGAKSNIPVTVSGLTGADMVAGGGRHTCARLSSDKSIRCWGSNFAGQLGVSSTTTPQSTTPVNPILSNVTALTAGNFHTCILLGDAAATVECFGSNNAGQLGNGSSTNSSGAVSAVTGATQIGAGLFHTCAILQQGGAVRCWGNGGFGQLGNGSSALVNSPVPVTGVSSPTAGAAGRLHTCAVVGGNVMCWGANFLGQLGNGTTADSSTPVGPSLTNVIEVATGANHTCAIVAVNPALGGQVFCWGANFNQQLGLAGPPSFSPNPILVSGIATAIKLAAGEAHTCAVLTGGQVLCWGADFNGQLGDGPSASPPPPGTPVKVSGIDGSTAATTAVDIAAGGDHTCALLQDSTVKCWGANFSGQLGNNTTTNALSPVQVVDGTNTSLALMNVAQIAAGDEHTCARLSGGTVQCWGANFAGQLGNSSFTNSSIPVAVTGLKMGTTASDIGAGEDNTCGRLSDGTVQCWGANQAGQLLNGTFTDSATPFSIPGITGAVNEVKVGVLHACANLSDGSVKCWGNNGIGQLGNGAPISYNSAQSVFGIGVTWKSSDTNVATINAAGLATAVGSGTATITATSGGVSGNTTLKVNAPPVANNQTASTLEDTATAPAITLSASDIDSLSLTFTIVTGPTHGTLSALGTASCTPNGTGGSNCTASVTYTPNADFNDNFTNPADSFTFKANDGLADSNTAVVTIHVTPVNDPPEFLDLSGNKIPDIVAFLSRAVDEDKCTSTKPEFNASVCQVQFKVRPGPATATDELTSESITLSTSVVGSSTLIKTVNLDRTSISVGAANFPALVTWSFRTNADQNNVTQNLSAVDPNAIVTGRQVTLTITDGGQSENPANPKSQSPTFTVSVAPVNDPPQFLLTSFGHLCGANRAFDCTVDSGSDGYNLTATNAVMGQRVRADDSQTPHKVRIIAVLPGPPTATDELKNEMVQTIATTVPTGGSSAIQSIAMVQVGPNFTTSGLPMTLSYQAVGSVSDLTSIKVILNDTGPSGTTSLGTPHVNMSVSPNSPQLFPVAVGPPITIDASLLLASNFTVLAGGATPPADATLLAGQPIRVPDTTGPNDTPSPSTAPVIPLLPGTYSFQTGPASFLFAVNASGATGTVSYDNTTSDGNPSLDETGGGFLTGFSTNTLTVKGHRLSLDALILQQVPGVLSFDINVPLPAPFALGEVDDMRVIPGQYTLRALSTRSYTPTPTVIKSTSFTVGNPSVSNFISNLACANLTVP